MHAAGPGLRRLSSFLFLLHSQGPYGKEVAVGSRTRQAHESISPQPESGLWLKSRCRPYLRENHIGMRNSLDQLRKRRHIGSKELQVPPLRSRNKRAREGLEGCWRHLTPESGCEEHFLIAHFVVTGSWAYFTECAW
eukprot:1142893-Pelagomonas_calceolata.AAC.7